MIIVNFWVLKYLEITVVCRCVTDVVGTKFQRKKVCRKHFKASDYRPENFSGKW